VTTLSVSLAVASSLAFSLALQPIAIHILKRRTVLDVPNARSSHSVPTPRGGGIVVVGAICLGIVLVADSAMLWGLFLTVAGAALLGFVEDIYGIPVAGRLLGQIAVAVPFVFAAVQGSWLFGLIAALYMVGSINCVNFMDGVNGITAGFGVAAGISYGLIFQTVSRGDFAAVSLCVAAACFGFLPYNALRARVFLGDSGSYGIGAAVGGLGVLAWVTGVGPVAALAPMVIYIGDTGLVFVRRLISRESLHEAHRSHVYQRLTDLGWSHSQVAILVSLLSLACGLLGVVATMGALQAAVGVALAFIVLLYLSLPMVIRISREKSRLSAEN